MSRRYWIAAVSGLIWLLALVACSGGRAVVDVEESGEGAVGPQEIKNATEVVRFDPASLPTSGDAVPGACVESATVPGTYRCDLEAGGAAEPCFALGGTRLLCGPNPAAGTYVALVSPTNTLPSVAPSSPDRAVEFFVEMSSGMTCAIRTGPEPVIIGGIAARYDCSEPYTYILEGGQLTLDKSAPLWVAAVYTLDPATGESSGKTPADIRRVWVP